MSYGPASKRDNVAVNDQESETASRGARMLRIALGLAGARFLEHPAIVEMMLNPG